MSVSTLLASVAVLGLAGFAHGLFGIGFAMIATPLLALFLDYRAAVFLSAVPLLVMAGSWLVVNRREVLGSGLPTSLLPAIAVGAVVGVALQVGLPEKASLLLLAALLAASVLMPWALGRWAPSDASSMQKAGPVFGVMAGVTESALNVGAPFMVLYGSLARLSRLQQLLALNLCFGLGKAIQVSLMSMAAPASVNALVLAAGTAASLLGYYAGDSLAGRFSDQSFRRLLRHFLLCMIGALMIRAALV